MPVAIFLTILSISFLSAFAIQRGEERQAAAELDNRTAVIASALERRANSSSAYLRAGAALLATLDEIPASRFRRFVSELRLDADYRGADGIGWAEAVRPDEVAAFNARLAAQTPGVTAIYPSLAANQPLAVPVTFLQPDTVRNRRALGFDMFSDPMRRAAMLEAQQTSRPTASGRVVLRQEAGGSAPGFMIFMPVFEPAASGRQLKGFIFSPFKAEDFLASALELEGAGRYGVRIYEGKPTEENLLARVENGVAGEGNVARQIVPIANHPWVLEVEAEPQSGLSIFSMTTLVFGLLAGLMLTVFIRMLTRQAIEDEQALNWFEEQASIRNSLTRELNHRVKNTLANVLSILALTRRRASNLDDFADSLDGRIRALSATHDLLTKSDWGTTPIRSVVEAELVPYAQEGDHQLDLNGPDVELAPNDALSLGLAVHELATNAAKYGALSAPGGTVSMRWYLVDACQVRMEWQERGGPPVKTERGRGFGTDLIQKIVAHELRNPVDLRFEKEGVSCCLTIPVRERGAFAMRADREQQDAGCRQG
ncbi:histidine kinase [Altererythrobacter endophyticus]|uniref:histidine kinase n=2 Tax=Altericroceibacterium endophyticum TaxID=1808508 RepID=A0A6I4T1H8_9SPHN|nr:CHASE domain-containing protein [Altericroceibacterium endophyticum]MXO65044.1 histidine kinase [Altericroceibacterium endophyticum]